MKKKDIITVKIDGVRFPNKAFGFVEGEKIIVKMAYPVRLFLHRSSKSAAAMWKLVCWKWWNALNWNDRKDAVPIMKFAAAALTRP